MVTGKRFPAFTVQAQPAILRIWQEAHSLGAASGPSSGFSCLFMGVISALNLPWKWVDSGTKYSIMMFHWKR